MKFSVNYIRDGLVEEFHTGLVCFENDKSDTPYYLRSCAKPLQASMLLDNNINLSEKELAFCSGSHAGEECHIQVAQELMRRFDIKESMLKCGTHAPLSRSMQDKMLLNGDCAKAIHNNCSGKHIAFLIVCKNNNWSIEDYYEPNHPLQLAVKEKINSLCDVNITYPMTTDGCGVPILSMPLENMAKGFINLLEQYPQIVNAIRNNSYVFGGENRCDTEIIQKTDDIIAKVGAGGLCIVLNIRQKKAFALKINDCSMEARRIAVFELINHLGWGDIKYDNSIKTLNGKTVGKITVSFE